MLILRLVANRMAKLYVYHEALLELLQYGVCVSCTGHFSRKRLAMPIADVSSWTLQTLSTSRECKSEVNAKLTDVEVGKTGEAVTTTVSGWSNMMLAAVVGGTLLVVAGIVTTVIILVTMGGGFFEMPVGTCAEGQSRDYIPIGLSAGRNVFTMPNGDKIAVKSDLLYFYWQEGNCSKYTGTNTGTDGWVPLYLASNDNKPSLPDAWNITAEDLSFGPMEEINKVKMYPLHMNDCMLYYKPGEASTDENRYNHINSAWPAIDHAGQVHTSAPTCV
jgi:hypothetical protein